MKNRVRLISILLLFVLMLQNLVPVNAQGSNGIRSEETRPQNKVLVKYRDSNRLSSDMQTHKGKMKKLFGERIGRMELDEVEEAALKQSSDVELVEADGIVQTSGDVIPWNVSYVNSPLIQDKGYIGKGVKVALFDTGIDTKNTDIKVAGGVSFVEGTTSFEDDNGHGTAMAGILAALKNNSGLVGTAPGIKLYSVKVLDSTGFGTYSNIIQGIDWAINNNIDIISMSFGGTQYSQILEETINEAYQKGILVIAAAGNEGTSTVNYPARYSSVVCVGAVDENGRVASFSNKGPEMDLVAPGVKVETTSPGNKTAVVYGTSAAVPHVAGVAAQILDAKKKLTPDGLKAILYKSAVPVPGMKKESYGWGIVNAYNSYENINAGLTLDENGENNAEFVGADAGTSGTVYMSFKILGDNQTINVGQTATVRAGFNSAHASCIVTEETSTGTVRYSTTYSPVYGNGAYITYTTHAFTSAGTYYVRYYCPDNGTHAYDDVFTIYVVSPTPTPTPTVTPTPTSTPTPTPTVTPTPTTTETPTPTPTTTSTVTPTPTSTVTPTPTPTSTVTPTPTVTPSPTPIVDSDGDGIPNSMETGGIPIGYNGIYITTVYLDPNKKDTDGDGMNDNVELINLKHYNYDSSAGKWFYEAIDNPNASVQGTLKKPQGFTPNYGTLFSATENIETYKSNITIANQYWDEMSYYAETILNHMTEFSGADYEQFMDYLDNINKSFDSINNVDDAYAAQILASENVDTATIDWVRENTHYLDDDTVSTAAYQPPASSSTVKNSGDVSTSSFLPTVFGIAVHTQLGVEFRLENESRGIVDWHIPNCTLRPDLVLTTPTLREVWEIKPITYSKHYDQWKYNLAIKQISAYIAAFTFSDRLNGNSRVTRCGTSWNPNGRIVYIPGYDRYVLITTFLDEPGMIYYSELRKKEPNESYSPVHKTVKIKGVEYYVIAEDPAKGLVLVAVGSVATLCLFADDITEVGVSDDLLLPAAYRLVEEGLGLLPGF